MAHTFGDRTWKRNITLDRFAVLAMDAGGFVRNNAQTGGVPEIKTAPSDRRSDEGARSMVTIGMNYKVLPGKEETFETAFNKVVHAMRGIDGHGETNMFREINDGCHYLIVSQWTSKAAFDSFIASDAFRNVANWGKEQILAGRPTHEVYGGDEPATGGGCPVHRE